jgi:hypothetical protein
MQLMPATARWTARKIGLDYKPEAINDRDINLRLGTGYLKLVLDDFAGSQAMAAAAYNAGPAGRAAGAKARDRAAAWAENIPFNETRDYVKKVLSNAVYYAACWAAATVPSLKPPGRRHRPARPRQLAGGRHQPALIPCPDHHAIASSSSAAPASSAAPSANASSSATVARRRIVVPTRRLAHGSALRSLPTVDW